MGMTEFIDKHKDKINKVKGIANEVLTNPEIMDNYRDVLKGTCEEGKATIKLKVKLESLWILATEKIAGKILKCNGSSDQPLHI